MAVSFPTYPFARLPSAANNKHALVVVTDCDPPVPCLAWSDGKVWKRLTLGMTVTQSPTVPATPRAYSAEFIGDHR
jgi:hypothetical protein